MVFVAHRMAGVHRIPAEWLDGFLPSGFREATPAEIAAWYDERGLTPPCAETTLSSADTGRLRGERQAGAYPGTGQPYA